MDRLARIAFVLALIAMAFVYGYVARSWKLFPYAQMKEASDAVTAVAKFYLEADYLEVPTDRDQAGVTIRDEAAMAPGLTFITLYTGDVFLARLLDAKGGVVHEWRASFREVWGEQPPHVSVAGDDSVIEWHGAHLYPNGDVLLNFEGHLFPYGGGLVKLDKDSKVIWKLARNTHHDVEVAEDGTIWVPSLNYRPEGMKELPGFEPWFYEDTVLKVSPDGQVLDEISIPLALRNMRGLLQPTTDSFDPTHLNEVDLVPASLAPDFPMLAAGDIVVSLRNINALVAIDPVSKKAKWSMVGPFRRQHDPDLLPGGDIILFDNLGGDSACGRSRILRINAVTQAITWQYDGCAGPRFDSEAWGNQQVLPNGNVLIVESFGGRVFEVTGEPKPRIVWEYVNPIGERNGHRIAGVVGLAHRLPPGSLDFVGPVGST